MVLKQEAHTIDTLHTRYTLSEFFILITMVNSDNKSIKKLKRWSAECERRRKKWTAFCFNIWQAVKRDCQTLWIGHSIRALVGLLRLSSYTSSFLSFYSSTFSFFHAIQNMNIASQCLVSPRKILAVCTSRFIWIEFIYDRTNKASLETSDKKHRNQRE